MPRNGTIKRLSTRTHQRQYKGPVAVTCGLTGGVLDSAVDACETSGKHARSLLACVSISHYN